MTSKYNKLYFIANSNLYDKQVKSKLRIPNIQRGLVWKPSQVELLWDSILRGFPIGSMLILGREDGQNEILDGQQRSNAIINGFDADCLIATESGKYPKSILWYDLGYEPEDSDEERRLHGIRLINSSHPWGYTASGNKLEAAKRKGAIYEVYGDKPPKNKSEWDIRKFLPYHFLAKNAEERNNTFLPIPLPFLVKAAEGKRGETDIPVFISEVKKHIAAFAKISPWWSKLYENRVTEFIANADYSFCKTFFDLNDYTIVFNYVTTEDDIELLFNRVNSKGTPMSNAELTYAAIKHYGSQLCNCEAIGEIIKNAAYDLMPEAQLAQILFRWCYSVDRIRADIDAGTIRKLALSLDEKDMAVTAKLRILFADSGKKVNALLQTAKRTLQSLDADGGELLPSIIPAEIAMKNPTLFILLLALVERHFDSLDINFIRGLIFYLYCFSHDETPTKMIFEAATQDSTDLKAEIQNILRDSVSHEWCAELPKTFKCFKALDDNELNKDWAIDKYSDLDGFQVFKMLFEYNTMQGAFMLKFAQRDYFNAVFGEYNPSNRELWDEINRPWDHDHIIPKSWRDDNDWAGCLDKWLNSWGNIADIPFEENRGKSNSSDMSYYTRVSNEFGRDILLTQEILQKVESEQITQKGLQTGMDSVVRDFLTSTRDRFLAVSEEFLAQFSVLGLTDRLSPMQEERKAFLESVTELLEKLDNSKYRSYYLTPSGIEKETGREITAWQKPWVSLMREDSLEWKKAFSVYILHEKDNTRFLVERGNRKKPELALVANNYVWWEAGSYSNRIRPKLMESASCDNHSAVAVQRQIDDYMLHFTLGADILNNNTGLNGFVSNNLGVIAYIDIIDNVKVQMCVYNYYSYYYAKISAANDEETLPERLLEYGEENNFTKYSETHIEQKLAHINEPLGTVFCKFKDMVQRIKS